MPDNPDTHNYSPAEIAAMRYAYRQILDEYPERYPDLSDKQELARSVIKSMESIRLSPTTDIVATIMEESDE